MKWKTLLIPGLMAMTHLSAATEDNFIDQVLSDDESQLDEVMVKPLKEINFQNKPSVEEQPVVPREKPKTRFGIGYEYRQNHRPDNSGRPERPERPQRPERPNRPGRFGQ